MLDAIVGGHGCNLKENNWKSVGGLGIEKVLMCNKEFLVACELGLFLVCLPRQSLRGCQTRLWRDHPALSSLRRIIVAQGTKVKRGLQDDSESD